jgi:hypothetical protein
MGYKNHSLLVYSSLTKIIVYCYNSTKCSIQHSRETKRDICGTHSAKRQASMDKIVVLERLALQDRGSMFYRIFVKEIRICFIGLSKLVTKDNSLMFYRISVNFRNFGEICDCL